MLKDYDLTYHKHWVLMGKEEIDKDLYIEMLDTCSDVQSIKQQLEAKDYEIDELESEVYYLKEDKESLLDDLYDERQKNEELMDEIKELKAQLHGK